MRPIRLELKGFTAFREKCEIDFSSLVLFAITGQTGAGKTSLLDAMTYALYGKTSRLNKAGKDLINQGSSSMSVLFRFRVKKEEYQVVRTIKGSTVTARLERLETGEWTAISGSLSDINVQVARIIGLDFDGFTKAVILPQGKFDVFLRGKPDERREVLNDLLDVRVYQRMMQSANEKGRLAEERIKVKEAEIDAAATPEAQVELRRELKGLRAQEKTIADIVDRLRNSLSDALSLREKRNGLEASRGELQDAERDIAAAARAGAKAKLEVQHQKLTIEELDRQIKATAYDSELHLRLAQWEQPSIQRKKLNEQIVDQDRKRTNAETNLTDAMEEVSRTGKLLEIAKSSLKASEQLRSSTKTACDALKRKHGSADAIKQLIEDLDKTGLAAPEINALQQAVEELTLRANSISADIEAAQEAVGTVETELKRAEDRYEHLHARDRVGALRHELQLGKPCPVCEQEVHSLPKGTDAKELAKAGERTKLEKVRLKKAQDALLVLETEAAGLPGRIDLAGQQVEIHKAASKAAADRAAQVLGETGGDRAPDALRLLIQQIKSAELAAQRAQASYESLQGEERIASDAFKNAEHKRQLAVGHIDNIKQVITSCKKNIAETDLLLQGAPSYEEIVSQLKTLKAAKLKREQLEDTRKANEKARIKAEEQVVRCAKDTEASENVKAKCVKSIEHLDKEITKLTKQLSKKLGDLELADSPDEALQIEGLSSERQKDLEAAQARVQQTQFALQSLAEKIADNERFREEIVRHRTEQSLYHELGSWLNAGNFQQFLLSSAFDLLAREGSKHLKLLSNDRYTFTYKDKEFEVIDNSYGGDARSVHTLSGGESFLASLSLALALAESIAELNSEGGTVALESLFLDEGFSTLDGETLNRVADAIQLLQNGNRLIGIITHVPSLADQMPARIEIEKTLSGSRVLLQKIDHGIEVN
jgi:exonuclease SbcC